MRTRNIESKLYKTLVQLSYISILLQLFAIIIRLETASQLTRVASKTVRHQFQNISIFRHVTSNKTCSICLILCFKVDLLTHKIKYLYKILNIKLRTGQMNESAASIPKGPGFEVYESVDNEAKSTVIAVKYSLLPI